MEKFKINLQFFAEPNTNVTTDAGMKAEMKTFYDDTLIDEATPQLVHDQFGQKRPIPKGKGKEIEFRKYASLPKATTPLTEGVTPSGKKLSVSTVKAEVSQYGDYVTISDMLDMTAIDNNVVEATKICGQQAGLTMDTITRNVLQGGTNVFYCPKIGTDGKKTPVDLRSELDKSCKLTVDMVKRVVAWFGANNAPKFGDSYVSIIHPYVAYDLTSDDAWIEAHKYATPENIYNGEIGKIAGVRFVTSSEAKIYTGTENDCPEGLAVFGSLFIAQGAYGVTQIDGGGLQTIIKQLGSAGSADPLNQRATVGWKGTKTAEILVDAYLVRVESVSELSEDAESN